VRDGGRVGGDGSPVGVGEVDVLARLDRGEKARIRADFQRIPANVGDFFLAFQKMRAGFGKCPRPGWFGASLDPA